MFTRFRIQHAIDDSWEWVYIVRGRIIARSTRTFHLRRDAVRDAQVVQRHAHNAEIDEES